MCIDNPEKPEQYLFNWPTNEKFAQANFLSSFSNEKAVKLIDNWPNWDRGNENFYALIIYGPAGCGKTHLSYVWSDISKARTITAKQLIAHEFLESKNLVFIFDDIDHYIFEPAIQEAFLHLFNWTKEQGGYLLLTATKRPKEWGVSLKDLSSRLLSLETVEIKTPDDYLLRAVIIKQFLLLIQKLPRNHFINQNKLILHKFGFTGLLLGYQLKFLEHLSAGFNLILLVLTLVPSFRLLNDFSLYLTMLDYGQ